VADFAIHNLEMVPINFAITLLNNSTVVNNANAKVIQPTSGDVVIFRNISQDEVPMFILCFYSMNMTILFSSVCYFWWQR
jgi:hypothetical protein